MGSNVEGCKYMEMPLPPLQSLRSRLEPKAALLRCGLRRPVAGGAVRIPAGKVYGLSFAGDPYRGGGVSLVRQPVGRLDQPRHHYAMAKEFVKLMAR